MALSGGTWLYGRTQKREMPNMLKDLVRLRPNDVSVWTGSKWQPIHSWFMVEPPTNRKTISQLNRSARHRGTTAVPRATYDIHLRSGERIGCLGESTFFTSRGCLLARNLVVGDILLASRLPAPQYPVSPQHLPDDMVGWFVGLYVAEGSQSSDTVQIASHVKEIDRFHRLQTIATAFHGTCAVHKTGGKSATANLNGPVLNAILDTYVSGRTAKGKHLNVRCWERPNDFLQAVLEGYLAGDGHYDRRNNRWRLGFTLNDAWALDMRAICARLGLSLRLNHATHTLNGRQFRGYRGQIRFKKSAHHNAKEDTEVVAIQQSRARKYWRIVVEGEAQRFTLASGVLCGGIPNEAEENRI